MSGIKGKGRPRRPLRFVAEPNGCLRCVSHRPNSNGRVQVNRYGRLVLVTHLVYEAAYGPLPDGMLLRHTCDNEWCVSLPHLVTGSQMDNVQDMITRGRARKATGERHWKARFTVEDILAIRASQELGVVLADRYQTSPQYISRIRCGTTWRHLNAA